MNERARGDTYVRVSGSDYEMGAQQGHRFAAAVRDVFARLCRTRAVESFRPKWIPPFLFYPIMRSWIARRWRRPIELIMPGYARRIKGIAVGSGTPLEDLYLVQALEVLAIDASLFVGCSSFVILPQSGKTAVTVAAKNFDFISELSPDHLVRQSEPAGGYRSLEVTYKQLAGAHDGINDRGLVVLYNYGLTRERTQLRVPVTILVQQLLERCATVDEAIMYIRTFRYPNGAILTLADRHNNAAVVEISPERIAVRRPVQGVLSATNRYLSPEMASSDIPDDAVYSSERMPPEFHGKRIHQSDDQRQARLETLLARLWPADIAGIERILRDHDDAPQGSDDTLCRHGSLLSTQVGMVFTPHRRTVRIMLGSPCAAVGREYAIV